MYMAQWNVFGESNRVEWRRALLFAVSRSPLVATETEPQTAAEAEPNSRPDHCARFNSYLLFYEHCVAELFMFRSSVRSFIRLLFIFS